MKIIHWNISYSSKKEKVVEYLKDALLDNDTVACLQEVTEDAFSHILGAIGGRFDYVYSLHFRRPGKYDGKNRRLGVLIICPQSMYIIDSGVLGRTPFPDRTAYAEILYCGQVYRIMSLHSITGCDYSKAKGTQYCSFAEAVDSFRPDIVTIDANEPKIDHYDPKQVVYYGNHDKGQGVRTYFSTMGEFGLYDAFATLYDSSDYVPGKPLTPSIKVNRKGYCRYDFLYANTSLLPVRSCRYLYEEGLAHTSDHAIIEAVLEPLRKPGQSPERIIENCFYPYNRLSEATLLKFCRYYKGPGTENDNLMAEYEHRWIQDVLEHNVKATEYVEPSDLHELEIFNPGDGVPLTLKALLFNRWCHWSSYATINQFKHWYLESYLGNK